MHGGDDRMDSGEANKEGSLGLVGLTLPYGLRSGLSLQPVSFSFLILPSQVAKGIKWGMYI